MKDIGLSLKTVFIMFAFIPMVIATVILTCFAYNNVVEKLEDQTREELQVVCTGLANYYDIYLEDGQDIPYEHDYVDSYKDYDLALTIFLEDVRYFTSIIDDKGERIEGTTAKEEIWTAAQAGDDYYSDGVTINNQDYYVYYSPLYDASGDVIGMAFAGKLCENVESAKKTILITCLIIAGAMIAIFGVLSVVLSGIIAKPLRAVACNVEKIANGNLCEKSAIESHLNETLQLINSQKKLQGKISEVIIYSSSICNEVNEKISEISGLIEGTSLSTEQISCAMNDLADGTMALASNVQDLNNQVVNIESVINDISDSVNVLADSADNIKNANDVAMEYMGKVSESSEKSVDSIDNISNQINETNNAIVKIDEAVGLITSVASQTNLLALNASIEAARAGEAGRGFAVVASEIQKLSEESNRGANEIKRIVGDIKSQSDVSVELSAKVKNIISQEQEYIVETRSKFGILSSEVDTSVEQIIAIKQKAENLLEIKNQLVGNVNDISAISEENAASNQEVSASLTSIAESVKNIASDSEEMSDKAKALAQSFEYFTM